MHVTPPRWCMVRVLMAPVPCLLPPHLTWFRMMMNPAYNSPETTLSSLRNPPHPLLPTQPSPTSWPS